MIHKKDEPNVWIKLFESLKERGKVGVGYFAFAENLKSGINRFAKDHYNLLPRHDRGSEYLENQMILLHFGKVIGHNEYQDVHISHALLGATGPEECAQRVWQKSMPACACCLLTTLMVTKVRERNTVMNQGFEDKTKGREMPGLFLCLFYLGLKDCNAILSGKSCRQNFL